MARDETSRARITAGHEGMADAGRDEVRGMVLPAWDAFIPQVEAADLDRGTRLPGWRHPGHPGRRLAVRRRRLGLDRATGAPG
jgi:hypothetical protein